MSDEPHHTPSSGDPSLSRLLFWAGMALSLGLLLGALWWANALGNRAQQGVILITPPSGEMRQAPTMAHEKQQGVITPYLGLSINGLTQTQSDAHLPESITPAPPPIQLDAIDMDAPSGTPLGPQTAQLTTAPQNTPPQEDPQEDVEQSDDHVSQKPSEEPAPLALLPMPAITPAPDTSDESAPKEESADARSEGAPERRAVNVAAQEQEYAPPPIPVGASLVQLGSFLEERLALAEWQRLKTRFGAFFRGKTFTLQTATVSGRQRFRLRLSGFANDNETRRFCAAIIAEGGVCIPVHQR